MFRASHWTLPLVAAGTCAFSMAAFADNPLGLYVGAGVGASNVDNSNYDYPYGYNGGFHDRDASWKALIGVRPVPVVGAELEYLDFGQGDGSNGFYGPASYYDYGPRSHPKATVLYGVGYLPLPLPIIDVFGKLGVARLQTDITYQTCTSLTTTPSGLNCSTSSLSRIDQQNTNFAFGAGVQSRIQDFAFRAEYERIQSNYGNPSTVMLSLTWTF